MTRLRRSSRSRRSRRIRGGAGVLTPSNSGINSENAPSPSSYGSAASYQIAVNGTPNSQFNRVNNDNSQSNAIVGIQGQRAGNRRKIKGGLWGEVINQAVVPLSILAAQQSYRRRKGGKRTRKLRRSRRH